MESDIPAPFIVTTIQCPMLGSIHVNCGEKNGVWYTWVSTTLLPGDKLSHANNTDAMHCHDDLCAVFRELLPSRNYRNDS